MIFSDELFLQAGLVSMTPTFLSTLSHHLPLIHPPMTSEYFNHLRIKLSKLTSIPQPEKTVPHSIKKQNKTNNTREGREFATHFVLLVINKIITYT